MPAKRRYNVKGTNDFLVLAGIFFFLCLWAVKDAWYPSDKVLKKHPVEVTEAFEEAGSVDKVNVKVGDRIIEKQVLATLRLDRMLPDYEAAKHEFTAARKKFARMELAYNNSVKNGATEAGVAERKESMDTAQAKMLEAEQVVMDIHAAMDAAALKAESKGVVKEVKIFPHTMVEAGEAAVIIDPKDHFYLFNKSLSIFSFFAFWIFLAIHILAR